MEPGRRISEVTHERPGGAAPHNAARRWKRLLAAFAGKRGEDVRRNE